MNKNNEEQNQTKTNINCKKEDIKMKILSNILKLLIIIIGLLGLFNIIENKLALIIIIIMFTINLVFDIIIAKNLKK